MTTPSREEVRQALDILEAHGRNCYTDEYSATQSRGSCIGLALAHLSDPPTVVDAAIEALEDWNGHLTVAAISAIEKGQGKVTRKGRKLTIMLPEWWGKM